MPPIPIWIKEQLHRPVWDASKLFKTFFLPNKEELVKQELMTLYTCKGVRLFDSGTSAIEYALTLIKDSCLMTHPERFEVIMPSYCCKCIADAVLNVPFFLKPVFVDVEEDFMVSVNTIRPMISYNTLAIIVPHMYGNKASVESIKEAFVGIPIIEDKATRLQGELVGDYGILTFNVGKQIQSTGGGALLIK